MEPDREFFVSLSNSSSSSSSLSPTMTLAPDDLWDFSYAYICRDMSDEHVTCPLNCTSLEACLDCECAVVQLEDTGGPWGQVMDVVFCLLPILYLLYATVKPNPTPTTVSLPTSAAILFLVRVMYLGSNPLLTSACVILGFHEALTPLSIMAGAITLFETMEATRCLPYMMREMKALTAGHAVAEVMLLFGFATLVEGASGFGTPVALGAPMLVSTGHPPLESVVVLLLFNTFATVWGAVGTPLWFGLGDLGLSEDDFLEISFRAAVAMIFSATILVPFILAILIPPRVVRRNLIFVFLSMATVMGPVLGLASVNYEFPSLMGGLIGCGLTGLLIRFRIGLAPMEEEDDDNNNDENDNDNTPNTVEPNEVLEITDLSRGYHRTISDLTEAVAPTATRNKGESQATTAKNSSSSMNGGTEPTPQEDDHDNDNDIHNKAASPRVNVEVQSDNHDDPSRTKVLVAEPSGEQEEQLEQGLNDNVNENNNEPPTVEQVPVKPDEAPNSKNQVLTQSQITRDREDALLGPRKSFAEGYLFELVLRTFPIWGVVIILILTRVQAIGIKEYLTKLSPHWEVQFGTYGDFRLSVSAVLQLRHILSYPGLHWKYELFYIPFLIPFVLVSFLTMLLYRKDMTCQPRDIAATVVHRLSTPAIALMGALVLVQLMIRNDAESPAFILGVTLADWLREGFVAISPILGALGSFFSGSTTVSNLTFGEIQKIAAEEIGTSVNTMLALQTVGASAGNGICLNNIISALAVVGLNVSEGQILKRTCGYVFASTTIATAIMLAFFFRF